MSHLSSDGDRRFALVNGLTDENPYVTAQLCVGDCCGGERRAASSQFSLCDAGRHAAHGWMMWDAEHVRNGSDSPFFSVAAVRLEVKASGECLLAVGTGDYVSLQTRPYRWIEKVQIAAAVAETTAPARVVRWDLIDIVLSYGDGRAQRFESACLPSVVSGGRLRRAAGASTPALAACVTTPRLAGQYAEMSIGSRDVVGLKLRGQVTLRANEGLPNGVALKPHDLLGRIAVFTDASDDCG
jgi:hypothetical protein